MMPFRFPFHSTYCLISALLVSGCMVGTDYALPTLETPEKWSVLGEKETDVAVQPAGVATTPWWARLNDKTLSGLVEQALLKNNDLEVARMRVKEAEADGTFSRSILFPQVNGKASYAREKQNASAGGKLDTVSQMGVSTTYEVDPFGGNRRRVEAAMAGVDAAIYNARQTELILVSEVARTYVRLRVAQKQRLITERNLGLQSHTLEVTRGQREEGAVSDLEVARARAQEQATAARLPQIDNAIANAINRLSVLTNTPAGTLQKQLKMTQPLPSFNSKVGVTTPIETIARRPDMQVAERRLAESSALSNAAFAQFFPKLTLEGFFGRQNSDLYGSLSPWSATATALLPLLNFGRISSQVDAADARQAQALANYKQTLLLALEETENALSGYTTEQRRRAMLADAAEQQKRAAFIAVKQYKAGTTSQLDLLTAQNSQLNAENDLVLSEAAVLDNLILLYRALGEQWVKPEAAPEATKPVTPAPEKPAAPAAKPEAATKPAADAKSETTAAAASKTKTPTDETSDFFRFPSFSLE